MEVNYRYYLWFVVASFPIAIAALCLTLFLYSSFVAILNNSFMTSVEPS